MSEFDTGFYVSSDRLSHYAENIGKEITVKGYLSGRGVAAQIKRDLRRIKLATSAAARYCTETKKVPKELEWLMDNWFLVEREGRDAIASVRHVKYLRAASRGENSTAAGVAASSLIHSGRGEITQERAIAFLNALQSAFCLNESELQAFIAILKAELISVISCMCGRIVSEIRAGKYEGSDEQLIGNVFSSLRFLSNYDSGELLTSVNRIEQILSKDPTREYALMDELSRSRYRCEIARLARVMGLSETAAAKKALKLAIKESRHIGYYIFSCPLGRKIKSRSGTGYIAMTVFLSLVLSLLLAFALDSPAVSILLLLPISEIVKNIIDTAAVRIMRPKYLPRLELRGGIPERGKTLCIISALLTSEQSILKSVKKLEEYSITNRDSGENLIFGILADLPEASSRTMPSDSAIMDAAKREFEKLNEKYNERFFLIIRPRVLSPSDNKYMGWERKRGAILQLCRALRKTDMPVDFLSGDTSLLENVKYIIALDSDTRLCAGTARELVGAAMHPQNRPVIDKKRGVVVSGSGIIQPRIATDLVSAGRSDFSRVFAGSGGTDPYSVVSSDVYQDITGSCSFSGKGIIDIDAYLACLDARFPENTVLSHDLLEGAYLRCSFLSDTEFTDEFPSKITNYYDRLHRWTRGDWQTAPWLFRRVRSAGGTVAKNVLSTFDKYKIFDNLRRSLTPVFTFSALFIAILNTSNDLAVCAAVAALAVLSNLLISSAQLLFSARNRDRKYHSNIICGFSGALMQSVIRVILLPYEAWVCLSAIITALYRMTISRKKMLEWVTAADSASGSKNSLLTVYKKMWPAISLALILLLFSQFIPAKALAVIWIIAPLFALSLSRDIKSEKTISVTDEIFLKKCAGDIWRYFDDLISPADNFLPPDNFQEQPSVGIAHRTSPTNIGLAILSALAALDLGITTGHKALGIIENILATVARLPKWNGHLYNWYDTQTLKILEPAYISTVDSGNFAASLTAARAALLEIGAHELAGKCDELTRAMDFSKLYDKQKNLFYIGAQRDRPLTSGWYDLMASEARQTSYYAIARGHVPVRHWRRLSRALVSKDQFTGMASWTGTMFEYLMPELLLPCFENSFLYETAKFCVYAQKHNFAGLPWGASESAFYEFDNALNYKYKAHGAQSLALKRSMSLDNVISPYSSFLAMLISPKSSIRNLRKISALSAEGRYGFYEALDFTPERLRNGKHETVRTFMAHHLGMSIVAIDNVINKNIMCERFMRDVEMSAFSELLQEKVPVGATLLRRPSREVPEKPQRQSGEGWVRRLADVDLLAPRCCVLSNGAYEVLFTETGSTCSKFAGITMTKFVSEQFSEDMGMSFFARVEGETHSLLPAPFYDNAVKYSSEMTGKYASVSAIHNGLRSIVTAYVPDSEAGEARTVELVSDKDMDIEILCFFEPVLARNNDYLSHPAFSKLSLETGFDNGCITIKRRPHSSTGELWLSFTSDHEMTFDTSRETSIKRMGVAGLKKNITPAGTIGAVLDPCVFTKTEIRLKKGVPHKLRFSLSFASKKDAAIASSLRILHSSSERAIALADEMAMRLRMSHEMITASFDTLSDLTFSASKSRGEGAKLGETSEGQHGFWKHGISGDLPVVAVRVDSVNSADEAERIIKELALLLSLGIKYDLVFLLREGGNYLRPGYAMLMETIRDVSMSAGFDITSRVHIIDISSENADHILAYCAKTIDLSQAAVPYVRTTDSYPAPVPDIKIPTEPYFSAGYNDDNSFTFSMHDALSHNAWSHILANKDFGFLATDCGTGMMWHKNSRENKINRWTNDSLQSRGSEKLELWHDGAKHSLFAAPDGCDCTVTYGFGFARWEKTIAGAEITVTAFVPPDAAARVIIIEASGLPEDAKITYYTDLVLGDNIYMSQYISAHVNGGLFEAQNPYNSAFPDTICRHFASVLPEISTTEKLTWITGNFENAQPARGHACFGAVYPAASTLILTTGCEDAETIKNLCNYGRAKRLLGETSSHWQSLTKTVVVKTDDKLFDRYIGGWATYQTIACRLFARTSLYQNGGAYGFRDQLQDTCSIIDIAPEIAREHILLAARHQYTEGDVQHWWHPQQSDFTPDKGVRTRCSDDLLWLPNALGEYVEKTGDTQILYRSVPYITSPPLSDNEHERYENPQFSDYAEPLFSHAKRAIELALRRGTGTHGLCYIGTGDWNDGMNLVGADGKGESVWLTWFFAHVLDRFAPLSEKYGDFDFADICEINADKLRISADSAWDGAWYLRGYYDNGSPLGSSGSAECQIDSIAQSFAAFAGGTKTHEALRSATGRLYDRENKIVKLFDPPFSDGAVSPGYIKGYSPGFRENGGQYTHGAVWLSAALFLSGMPNDGFEILRTLLPLGRDTDVYRTEPYVIAADVYANEMHTGRGGWTWYTGASGWYRRVAIEYLLGLKVRDGRLFIEPNLPTSWNGFEAVWNLSDRALKIKVIYAGGYKIFVNNAEYDASGYPLKINNNLISKLQNL